MVDVHDTLGTLVTANPDRARTLEALGLDYCCEGGRPLEDACRSAGRSLDEVVAALEATDAQRADGPPAWTALAPDALLDDIVDTHHAWLRAEAPRLVALGRKVLGVHGDRHPELAQVVADLEQLWAELEPHLDQEEADLFPRFHRILATTGAGAGAGETVDLTGLRDDHDAAGALLDALREGTSIFEPPADGCASYQAFYAGLAELDADTRLHVHKENNIVFPALVA